MNNKVKQRLLNLERKSLNDYGKGQIYSVAYDTAWMARVPLKNNLKKPAFPKALDWLTARQQADGSFGSVAPLNKHANIISTLAAILAFAQWSNPKYSGIIDSGLVALDQLANDYDPNEYDTIAFELLFPALYQEANLFSLKIPKSLSNLYKRSQNKYTEKLSLLVDHQNKIGKSKEASWWFSLEILGSPLSLNKPVSELKAMVTKYGSVAASPAATAYLLTALRFKGSDLPAAENYLRSILRQPCNKNSLPNVYPIDEFELAFTANYLFEAGLTTNYKLLSTICHQLKNKWRDRNGQGIGYSNHFITDPDGSSVAMMALRSAGLTDLDVNVLTSTFNGEYIQNFKGERIASISANIHVLKALRQFPPSQKMNSIINSLVEWLENQTKLYRHENLVFKDKWHYSDVYPTARAVLSLMGLHDELAQQCIDWLLENQHTDGGWGKLGKSNAEESGFASLALANWQRYKSNIPSDVLHKAQHYLTQSELFPKTELWIGKVLYCPRLVSATITTAGLTALSNLQINPTFTLLGKHAVNYPNFGSAHLKLSAANEKMYSVELSCAADRFQPSESTANEIAHHYIKWGIKMGICRKNSPLLNNHLAFASASALRSDDVMKQQLFADFALWVLSLDDILDEHWQKVSELESVFAVFSDIFKGYKLQRRNLKSIRFPYFKEFCTALKDISYRINKLKIPTQYFNRSLNNYFSKLLEEYQLRIANKSITEKQYLNIRMIAGGTQVSCELAFLLHGIKLPKSIRENKHFKLFSEAAFKALILSNDLLSLSKEKNHTTYNDNYIYLKGINRISETIKECALLHNTQIHCLFEERRKLLIDPNNTRLKENLQKALAIIANHTQAHLDWAMMASRYRSSLRLH